jgi:hypothetical protein
VAVKAPLSGRVVADRPEPIEHLAGRLVARHLERSLELALGSDLNTGWHLWGAVPSTTSGG